MRAIVTKLKCLLTAALLSLAMMILLTASGDQKRVPTDQIWQYPVPRRKNTTILRFNVNIAYLEYLCLTDSQIEETEEDNLILAKRPIFVTGISHGFEDTLKSNLIDGFLANFPNESLVVYDLGLIEESMREIEHPKIIIKPFNFSIYPPHIRDLANYAWKPIIIAEMLKIHPVVWWMDSSLYWKPKPELADIGAIYNRIRTNDLYAHVSIAGGTGHSMLAATDPQMFQYFPLTEDEKKTDMVGATSHLVFATKDVKTNIIKWLVLCALERDCIAPVTANLYCDFNEDRFNYYANCHRFDQSVLSILLGKRNDFNLKRYLLPGVGLDIRRF